MPRIYHITHERNLPAILAAGGLHCVASMQGVGFTSIAHTTIQARRSSTLVPCGPGGVLHDFVPFYFGPRSPMLYAIACGKVDGHSGGQDPIVYLVSDTEDVIRSGARFVFTDGHAAMVPLTSFFDDPAMLDRVDFPLMREKFWYDTPEDNDRKRRRQAEFLVHQFVPWSLIRGIGVRTSSAKARVEAILEQVNMPMKIVELPRWYYEGYP